jgi:hypothetical protein
MPETIVHHPSSYRDPSGYIFVRDGIYYRQVNKIYKEDFEFFINSGCYDSLVSKKILIPHEIIHENISADENYYQVLKPVQLPFTSYPWEWCFSMLKDAALLTLAALKESLKWGLVLKDATPYNIQWNNGRLQFIDTLSFERYDEKKPWIAYRQFCTQFLSPLLLSHYAKQQLPQLLLAYPEGIPLKITSALLPLKTRFSLHTYLHIHLQSKYSDKHVEEKEKNIVFSKKKLLNMVDSLEILVNKLQVPVQSSNWSEYYDEAGERDNYLSAKQELISKWMNELQPLKIADFGANTGEFSQLASSYGMVIATDFDPNCIEKLYLAEKQKNNSSILPLVIDLSSPSPSLGVNNKERTSFINRTKVDLGLALALIHHLSIGKNIPFDMIAAFFSKTCNNLFIEYVPKTDPKIKLMLSQKKDIYTGYSEENFITAFSNYFFINKKEQVGSSGRILFYLQRK